MENMTQLRRDEQDQMNAVEETAEMAAADAKFPTKKFAAKTDAIDYKRQAERETDFRYVCREVTHGYQVFTYHDYNNPYGF